MPHYYCDYCDAYLTHDSMAGRQQHMRGTPSPYRSVFSLDFFIHFPLIFGTFNSVIVFFSSVKIGWKHRENFKNYYQQFYPQWMMQQQVMHVQQMQQHQQAMMTAMALPPPPGIGLGMPPPPPGSSFFPPPPMAHPPVFRPPPAVAPPTAAVSVPVPAPTIQTAPPDQSTGI